MAEFSSPPPVINNPFRQLRLHPKLVADLAQNAPDELSDVISAAGKTLLKIYHPDNAQDGSPENLFRIKTRRSAVQTALQELSTPEGVQRALRDYRNVTPQVEVDRLSNFVQARQDFLKATKDAMSRFLLERTLTPDRENIARVRGVHFKVLDMVGMLNYSRRTSREIASLFERSIQIDKDGVVVGGQPAFFPEAPEKRAVAILTIEGEDLSLRSLENVLRHQGVTVMPPSRSIPDYSKGEPVTQPWREFSSVLGAYEIERLAYGEIPDATVRLSALFSKPSDERQSYLITVSRVPDRIIRESETIVPQRDIFYLEGLIQEVSYDESAAPSVQEKPSAQGKRASAKKSTTGRPKKK